MELTLSLDLGPEWAPPIEIANPRLDALGEVEWSYSKRSAFEQCLLQYFLNYYASHKNARYEDFDGAELRKLKALSNRFERTGNIAHSLISAQLKRAQRSREWSAERLAARGAAIFERDIEYSDIDYSDIDYSDPYACDDLPQYPSGNNPATLSEFYNGSESARADCREALERLKLSLRQFADSAKFDFLRMGALTPDTRIESSIRLPSFPCKISGRVDLAFRDEEGVVVADWKTGEVNHDGDDSLQLGAYALWASEVFGTDKIRVYKAYLGADEVVEFRATPAILAATRTRILQDAERIASMHSYGIEGLAGAFTPCAQAKICRLCPFARLCPARKEFSHAQTDDPFTS